MPVNHLITHPPPPPPPPALKSYFIITTNFGFAMNLQDSLSSCLPTTILSSLVSPLLPKHYLNYFLLSLQSDLLKKWWIFVFVFVLFLIYPTRFPSPTSPIYLRNLKFLFPLRTSRLKQKKRVCSILSRTCRPLPVRQHGVTGHSHLVLFDRVLFEWRRPRLPRNTILPYEDGNHITLNKCL